MYTVRKSQDKVENFSDRFDHYILRLINEENCTLMWHGASRKVCNNISHGVKDFASHRFDDIVLSGCRMVHEQKKFIRLQMSLFSWQILKNYFMAKSYLYQNFKLQDTNLNSKTAVLVFPTFNVLLLLQTALEN